MKDKDKDESKELQIFQNPEFGEVRTVNIDGEPWLVGKDVATALGYEKPTKAVSDHVDEEDKKMGPQNGAPSIKDSLGREQYPVFINESGLYSLVLSSKLPTAKKFKRWVTSEVLPAIRKTGSYSIPHVTPNPHYRTRMIGTAVRDVGKTAEALEKVFGCRHGMALATASSMVGEAYGIDMTPVQRLIPAEDNPGTLSPSQIAESLGLFNRQGNPDAQTVNRMLQSCGLQDKPRDTSGANLKNAKWFLTEEGKFYGEQKPMDNKRTGYKGYQICWNADVLELLRKALN